MRISFKPLWHTLLDKGWTKNNMIANMGKDKGIQMETLARICEALDCEITDVIGLVRDDPTDNGGEANAGVKGKDL